MRRFSWRKSGKLAEYTDIHQKPKMERDVLYTAIGSSNKQDSMLLAYAYNSLLLRVNEALQQGANPNATNKFGETALHLIAENRESYTFIEGNGQIANKKKVDILRTLIDAGVEINATNFMGKTALMLCAAVTYPYNEDKDDEFLATEKAEWVHDTKNCLNLLTEHGADWSIKDDNGKTALDFAIKANQPEIIHFIKNELKVSSDQVDSEFETPSMSPVESHHMLSYFDLYVSSSPPTQVSSPSSESNYYRKNKDLKTVNRCC